MTVLIAYATIEGQTGKIASFIRDEVGKSGRSVILRDLSGDARSVSLEGVDEIILAAPVHERRHPATFEAFLAGLHDGLGTRRTLLVSVSLSAAFEDGLEEAEDYVLEMKMRTGFSPDAEAFVAGAVRSGSYDHFQSQVVRHVVLRDRDYEPGESEHEFTDWAALSATIQDFLRAER